jgi:hypothetical protein
MRLFDDPSRIDTSLDCRSISFENPTGARGAGGSAAGGRKGAPSRLVDAGERLILADIAGPGRIRHIWMTFPPAAPEQMRAVLLEVFYDELDVPSVSVPCLDFFGLPHGRPAAYFSALTSVQEGRGFNSTVPLPFGRRVRVELINGGPAPIPLYYQIDYTLGDSDTRGSRLHVAWRRENPTTPMRDFVVTRGLRGPGRFLGCALGIRVLRDDMGWYGEGEFKFYRDEDAELPTICGTGLEDYVGTAWGMGQHTSLYAGVPVHVAQPGPPTSALGLVVPDFVGLYRWHIADPIVFRESLTVTVQQIGALAVSAGEESKIEELSRRHKLAGNGWQRVANSPIAAFAIAERSDDYSAAAFVYCRDAQAVPRVDVNEAIADIGRKAYEA